MTIDADIDVLGWVHEGFEPVRQCFAANFARQDAFREIGAGLAAFHKGRCVVDLWGGRTGMSGERAWTSRTLVNVWSATKGATACAVAKLVDEGAIRYADPVASVWPQFAQNGKAKVTIAQIMSHQSGLPGFEEPTTIAHQYDWDACCEKLARQAPAWPPGTATSYHAMTFGWLAGEIVRRVSAKSIGAYLREAITGPLEVDLHIGLPEDLESRVARIAGPQLTLQGVEPPPWPARMALENPVQDAEAPNDRAWRAAEIPAANGQASAMGLARLYAALSAGGAHDGVRVLSARGVDGLIGRATRDGRKDMLMGFEDCWGMGVMLNPANIYGSGARAFGHSGWGGSFGCADPDLELAIGYVCNQMGPEAVIDPRSVALSAAITTCAARA